MQGSAWALPCYFLSPEQNKLVFVAGRAEADLRMDSRPETVSDSRDYPAAGTKQACLCGRKCRSGSESEFPARDLLRFISICIWIYEKADPEKKVCSGDRISLVRTSMLSCICCTPSRSVFLYQRVRSVFESGFLCLTVLGADPAQGKRKIDLKTPLFGTDSAAF